MECARTRRAGILNVHNRQSQKTGVPECRLTANHLLSRHQPCGSVAEHHDPRLGSGNARIGERVSYCLFCERAHPALWKFPERRHPDARDHDVSHLSSAFEL